MTRQAPDPIASWFVAAEELGEFVGIRFGRLAPGANEPEWIFLPHIYFDGIGGLAEILRRKGAKVERLPQIKYPAAQSWFSLLRALPKYLSPRRRVEWRPLRQGPARGNSSQPPRAVAWHVFDEETTAQIRWACKKSDVTVNSFLLKHLTRAIRPFLEDQSSVVSWMIPVNIRGKVDREPDTAIRTSYVGVRVKPFETVHDVHRKVHAALSRGEHWGNWRMFFLGRFIPASMRRLLVATGWCLSQWNLGCFSNLGDWDPDKKITHSCCQGAWLFCPPVLHVLSVSAGCATFQNRLSLTIQAHPSLTTDPAVPKVWVQNWVKETEIDLARVLEPATAVTRVSFRETRNLP